MAQGSDVQGGDIPDVLCWKFVVGSPGGQAEGWSVSALLGLGAEALNASHFQFLSQLWQVWDPTRIVCGTAGGIH